MFRSYLVKIFNFFKTLFKNMQLFSSNTINLNNFLIRLKISLLKSWPIQKHNVKLSFWFKSLIEHLQEDSKIYITF